MSSVVVAQMEASAPFDSTSTISDLDAQLRIVSLPMNELAQDVFVCHGGVPGFVKNHIEPMVFLLARVASRNYSVRDSIPPLEGDEHVAFCAWIGVLMRHFVCSVRIAQPIFFAN